jgi:hypothetical protein
MPASWRASDLTIFAAAAAGTVLLTVASFLIAPPDLLPRNDGSSYAAHPGGGKAAFLLLQQMEYTIGRSFEPLTSLAGRTPESTALVLASPSQAASEQDKRALLTFLEQGGFVLGTGAEAAGFLPGGLRRTSRAAAVEERRAATPSPLSAGIDGIEMSAAVDEIPLHSPFVPVFGSFEEPAVLTARFGRGRAVWWSGSGPLANGGISAPGHVELLLNALGPASERLVLWDEFYHGHSRSVWSYLAATPLLSAALQLSLIGAIALFTFGRRRQPIRPLVVEPRTSPLEFIETMGRLYERARAATAAVATVRERVRRRLLEVLGLPPTTPDDRLATAAAERLTLGADAGAVLRRAREATSDPDLASREGVAIASELQALAADLRTLQRKR